MNDLYKPKDQETSSWPFYCNYNFTCVVVFALSQTFELKVHLKFRMTKLRANNFCSPTYNII